MFCVRADTTPADLSLTYAFLKFFGVSRFLTLSTDIVESLFDEGVAALDPVKQHAGRDYVFMLSMEQRQASGWFVAGAAAAAYASVLPLEQRHPLHFIFLVSALFMAFINANHAGLPLGWNPLVTDAGELLGMVLGPFWLVTALFNFKGFVDSRAALKTLQIKTD